MSPLLSNQIIISILLISKLPINNMSLLVLARRESKMLSKHHLGLIWVQLIY